MARFGRIDALVNNAGRSAHALFDQVEDLGWYEELMRINLWGAVWCTHAALPYLKASRGSIVAVSSLVGLVGVPGRTAYAATKFAMTGFFEALRAELKGAGVSVTTAFPGVVATSPRYRGFNAAGQAAGVSALKEDDAMPVEQCARLIIDGMNRRRREVVMTLKGKVGRYLKLIAPGWWRAWRWPALRMKSSRTCQIQGWRILLIRPSSWHAGTRIAGATLVLQLPRLRKRRSCAGSVRWSALVAIRTLPAPS